MGLHRIHGSPCLSAAAHQPARAAKRALHRAHAARRAAGRAADQAAACIRLLKQVRQQRLHVGGAVPLVLGVRVCGVGERRGVEKSRAGTGSTAWQRRMRPRARFACVLERNERAPSLRARPASQPTCVGRAPVLVPERGVEGQQRTRQRVPDGVPQAGVGHGPGLNCKGRWGRRAEGTHDQHRAIVCQPRTAEGSAVNPSWTAHHTAPAAPAPPPLFCSPRSTCP